MRKTLFIFGIAIVLLLVVGWLVSRIGGVNIRTAARLQERVTLSAPTALSPGILTTVRWTLPQEASAVTSGVVLRTSVGEETLTVVPIEVGEVRIVVPCDAPAGDASLVLVRLPDREVLGQQRVQLLTPGMDCALQ